MTPKKIHSSKSSVKRLKNSISHHNSRPVSPEQTIPKLELIPEVVDKRTYDKRKINPDYILAGSLYIPRNILRVITAEEKIPEKSDKYEQVFSNKNEGISENLIEVKDAELRKYIQRIVRYSAYSYDDAISTVRKASYEIKHQARYTIQNATTEEVEIWKSTVMFNQDESDSSEEDAAGEVQTFQKSLLKDSVQRSPSLLRRLLGAKMTVNNISKEKLLQEGELSLMVTKPKKKLLLTSGYKERNCKIFLKYKYTNIRQIKKSRLAFISSKSSSAVEYLDNKKNVFPFMSEINYILGKTSSHSCQEILNTDFKNKAKKEWKVSYIKNVFNNFIRNSTRKKNSFELFSNLNKNGDIIPLLDLIIYLTAQNPDLTNGVIFNLCSADITDTFYVTVNYSSLKSNFSCCCCKCSQTIKVRKKDAKLYADSFQSDSEISEEKIISKPDYGKSQEKIISKPDYGKSQEKRIIKPILETSEGKLKRKEKKPNKGKRRRRVKKQDSHHKTKSKKTLYHTPHFIKRSVVKKQNDTLAKNEVLISAQKTSDNKRSKPLFHSPMMIKKFTPRKKSKKEKDSKPIKKKKEKKTKKGLEEDIGSKNVKKKKKKDDKNKTPAKTKEKIGSAELLHDIVPRNSLFYSPLSLRKSDKREGKKRRLKSMKEPKQNVSVDKSFLSKPCVDNDIVEQIKIDVEYGSNNCNAFLTSISSKEKSGSNELKLTGNSILLQVVTKKPTLKDSTTMTSSITCLCRPATSNMNWPINNTEVTSAFYGLFYDIGLKRKKYQRYLGKNNKLSLYKGASDQKINPLLQKSPVTCGLYKLKNVNSVPLTNAARMKQNIKNSTKNCKYVYTSKNQRQPVNNEKLLVLNREINGREYSAKNLHKSFSLPQCELELEQNEGSINSTLELNIQKCTFEKDDTVERLFFTNNLSHSQDCLRFRESSQMCAKQTCLSAIQRHSDSSEENDKFSIGKRYKIENEKFTQTSPKRKTFSRSVKKGRTLDGSLSPFVSLKKEAHSYPKMSKILNLHLSQNFSVSTDSENEDNIKNNETYIQKNSLEQFNSIYPDERLKHVNKESVHCFETYWNTVGHGLKYDDKNNGLFTQQKELPMTNHKTKDDFPRDVIYHKTIQFGNYSDKTQKHNLTNQKQENRRIEDNSIINKGGILKSCGVQTENIPDSEYPFINKKDDGFYAISIPSSGQSLQKQFNSNHSKLNKFAAHNLPTFKAINDAQNYNLSLQNEIVNQNKKEKNNSINVNNKRELTMKDGRSPTGVKASNNDENPINLFLGSTNDMAKCAFVSISNVEKVVICGPDCNNLAGVQLLDRTKKFEDSAKTPEEYVQSLQRLDQEESEFSPTLENIEKNVEQLSEGRVVQEMLSQQTQTISRASLGAQLDELEPVVIPLTGRKISEKSLQSNLVDTTGTEFLVQKQPSTRKSHASSKIESVELAEAYERISHVSPEQKHSVKSRAPQNVSFESPEAEYNEITEEPEETSYLNSGRPSMKIRDSHQPETNEMDKEIDRISNFTSGSQSTVRSTHSPKLSLISTESEHPEIARLTGRQPSVRSRRSQTASSLHGETEYAEKTGLTKRQPSVQSRRSQKSSTRSAEIERQDRFSDRISHRSSERQPSVKTRQSQKSSLLREEKEHPEISGLTERQPSVRSRRSQKSTASFGEIDDQEMFSDRISHRSSERQPSVKTRQSQKSSLLHGETETPEITGLTERQPSVRSRVSQKSMSSTKKKSSQKLVPGEPAEIAEEPEMTSHRQSSMSRSGSRRSEDKSLKSTRSQKLSRQFADAEQTDVPVHFPTESQPSIRSHGSQMQEGSSSSRQSSDIVEEPEIHRQSRGSEISMEAERNSQKHPESQNIASGVLGSIPYGSKQPKDTQSTQNSVFSSESPIFVQVRQENTVSKKRFICYELDENGKIQSQILFPFSSNTSEAQTSTIQHYLTDELNSEKVNNQTKHDPFQETSSMPSSIHSNHRSTIVENEQFPRKSYPRNNSNASNEFDATHSRYSNQHYQKCAVQCSNKCICGKNNRTSYNYVGQSNEKRRSSSFGNHKMSISSPSHHTNESKHSTREVVDENQCRRMNVVWKCKCQMVKKENNKDTKILKDGTHSSKEKEAPGLKNKSSQSGKSKPNTFNCYFVYLPDYQCIYQYKDSIMVDTSMSNEINAKYFHRKEKLKNMQIGKTFNGSNINTLSTETVIIQMVLLPLKTQKSVTFQDGEKRNMIHKKNKKDNRSFINFQNNSQILPNSRSCDCACNQENLDNYLDFYSQYKKKSTYSKKKLSLMKNACSSIFPKSAKEPIKTHKSILKKKTKYYESKSNFELPNKKPNEKIYSFTKNYCNKVVCPTRKENLSIKWGKQQEDDKRQILEKNKQIRNSCVHQNRKIGQMKCRETGTQVDIKNTHRCCNHIRKKRKHVDCSVCPRRIDEVSNTIDNYNSYNDQNYTISGLKGASQEITSNGGSYLPLNSISPHLKTRETGTLTDFDRLQTNMKTIEEACEATAYSAQVNNNNVLLKGILEFKEPKMEYNRSRQNSNFNSPRENTLHKNFKRETVHFSGTLMFEDNTPRDSNYGSLSAHILHQTLTQLLNNSEKKEEHMNCNLDDGPNSRKDYSAKSSTCSSDSLRNEESDFSDNHTSEAPNQRIIASYPYDGRSQIERMGKSIVVTSEESQESVGSQTSDVESCDDYIYSTLGVNNYLKKSNKDSSSEEYIFKNDFLHSKTLINSMNPYMTSDSSDTNYLSNALLKRAFKSKNYQSRSGGGSFKINSMCMDSESSGLSDDSVLCYESNLSFFDHE